MYLACLDVESTKIPKAVQGKDRRPSFDVREPGIWFVHCPPRTFLESEEADIKKCIEEGGGILFVADQACCGLSVPELRDLEPPWNGRLQVYRGQFSHACDKKLIPRYLQFREAVHALDPGDQIPWDLIQPPSWPEHLVAIYLLLKSLELVPADRLPEDLVYRGWRSIRKDVRARLWTRAWGDYKEIRNGNEKTWQEAAGLPAPTVVRGDWSLDDCDITALDLPRAVKVLRDSIPSPATLDGLGIEGHTAPESSEAPDLCDLSQTVQHYWHSWLKNEMSVRVLDKTPESLIAEGPNSDTVEYLASSGGCDDWINELQKQIDKAIEDLSPGQLVAKCPLKALKEEPREEVRARLRDVYVASCGVPAVLGHVQDALSAFSQGQRLLADVLSGPTPIVDDVAKAVGSLSQATQELRRQLFPLTIGYPIP